MATCVRTYVRKHMLDVGPKCMHGGCEPECALAVSLTALALAASLNWRRLGARFACVLGVLGVRSGMPVFCLMCFCLMLRTLDQNVCGGN